MSALSITERNGAVRFSVRVVPRASRTEVDGAYGAALRIRLAAPPVDGAANDALIRALADALDVNRAGVRIVSGHTSRTKLVEVDGVTAAAVARLAG